jgi:hypothetical protein
MAETQYSSGGEVEHEVSTLFHVVDSDTDIFVDLHDFQSPLVCC